MTDSAMIVHFISLASEKLTRRRTGIFKTLGKLWAGFCVSPELLPNPFPHLSISNASIQSCTAHPTWLLGVVMYSEVCPERVKQLPTFDGLPAL